MSKQQTDATLRTQSLSQPRSQGPLSTSISRFRPLGQRWGRDPNSDRETQGSRLSRRFYKQPRFYEGRSINNANLEVNYRCLRDLRYYRDYSFLC